MLTKTTRFLAAVLTSALLLCACSAGSAPVSYEQQYAKDPEVFRSLMREWVISISAHAQQQNEDFIIIAQNCSPLFTTLEGETCTDFISALNGTGQEGLSFGAQEYGTPRPQTDKTALTQQLILGRDFGLTVLCTDYCSKPEHISKAGEYNSQHSFLSFQADSLDLTDIQSCSNPNSNNITTLSQAENFLLLLNPENFSTKKEYVSTLSSSAFDVLIIDAFFDDMLTNKDLSQLKQKPQGGGRLIISYLSIGEAENYRWYWTEEYSSSPPSWLLAENPNWCGNYPVEYWNTDWQNIIAFSENSYLNRIISAGFDGIYLDIVDGYETFEYLYNS